MFKCVSIFARPQGFLRENEFVVGKFNVVQIQRPNVAFHRAGNRVGLVEEGGGGFAFGRVFDDARAGGELDAADFGDAVGLSGNCAGDARICRHHVAVFGFG